MTAEPPYVQFLNHALKIEPLLNAAENVFKEEISSESDHFETDDDDDEKGNVHKSGKTNGFLKYQNFFSATDWKEEKQKFYNLDTIDGERGWLKEILLSDSSDFSEDDDSLSEGEVRELLQRHIQQKRIHRQFMKNPVKYQEDFQFYGSSFVLERDKYHDFQKKQRKDNKGFKKKSQADTSQKKKRMADMDERRKRILEEKLEKKRLQRQREADNKRRKLWILIARKEIPKAWRQRNNARSNQLQTLKKVSHHCLKEIRKEAIRSQKISKEMIPKARRLVREVLLYWKKFDKVEKEHRKKAEKEALEQRRLDEEMREMRRQQRKLNFLITQTELYAHFMGRKMKGPGKDNTHDDILKKLDEPSSRNTHMNVKGGVLVDVENQDDYDPESMKAQALLNAQNAVMLHEQKTKAFDDSVGGGPKLTQESFDQDFSLANPKLFMKTEKGQPEIFCGKLKTYQLKGMNWLADLYEQGINGILADEMGLGKTVQSIAFLAYLSEFHDIWGPFLVVAPASTLHNWQQETSRFVPEFKVLPYWGNPSDRKSLRKFWNQRQGFVNTKESAPFHVLITSYQLVVQDVRYFQRIKWQYLVLDEAQAIKSSASVRWKILLGFNCRNRLLLTGTPIQNSMAELWALLHFIMPTLFDSHEEFNEWFSKDIEGHAENKTNLDQNQLSRLHMILKPFMLRRVKKDVENELSDKIEIKFVCQLSSRQRFLYQAIKNKISIEDLVASSSSSSSATLKSTSTLMNLVMQFRKVCNHPEIFERRDVKSPMHLRLEPLLLPKLLYRRGFLNRCGHSRRKLLCDDLTIWRKDYIAESLKDINASDSPFSFSRFSNLSPAECSSIFTDSTSRLLHLTQEVDDGRLAFHSGESKRDARLKRKFMCIRDMLIWPLLPASFIARQKSAILRDLIFVTNTTALNGHLDHKIYRRRGAKMSIHFFNSCSDQSADHAALSDVPTNYPKFLNTLVEKVTSPPRLFYASDRDAAYKTYDIIHGSSPFRQAILHGSLTSLSPKERNRMLFPPPMKGLEAARPDYGWTHLQMPDRNAIITDSGKLKVLDGLLTRLKAGGHRVLIYSQMTRMIDILEEFMVYKKYKYMRLDGSSKISDRRDMVSDFQTKSDIFVFLLSTRAGGLGINLTAADTVIFYDSDWNPTVDQQAMDRAHRLGQTKQVTVYRLVTKGSIEERILQRAKEKSEIQKLVISGGHFKPDALKPKEVVSLLLDDDEMENKFKLKQAERRSEEQTKKGGRKRKRIDAEAEQPIANHLPKKKGGSLEGTEIDGCSSANGETSGSYPGQLESILPNPSAFGDESLESTDVVSLNFNEDSNASCGTPQSSRPPSTAPVISEPSSPTAENTSKRGKSRGRGRGRGSSQLNRNVISKAGALKGRGGKSKGASLNVAAAAAAAAAGAAAASAAAYAAYGFSFQATPNSNSGYGTDQA